MPPTDEATTSSSTPRVTRAKRACLRCNARKLRCDVVNSQPCRNCVSADTPCEVVPSRRGIYQRRSRHLLTTSMSPHPSSLSEAENTVSAPSMTGTTGHHSVLEYPGTLYNVLRSRMHEWGKYVPPASDLTLPYNIYFADRTLLPPECYPEDSPESYEPIRAHMQSYATKNVRHPIEERSVKIRFLREEGALAGYFRHQAELALMEYLTSIHPSFPILDRDLVVCQILSGTTSLLLLVSIISVVVVYDLDGEAEFARGLGFHSSLQAQYNLYNRAKLLFQLGDQTGDEEDKATIIQSAFLLSFCKGLGPHSEHAREWLGVAIDRAELLGLHRSSSFAQKDPQETRMHRKLWWSIYVRERHVAAFLGLPCRIRESDFYIEPPTILDFPGIASPEDAVFGKDLPEHAAYFIATVEITRLLGLVVDCYFGRETPKVQPDVERAIDSTLATFTRNVSESSCANRTLSRKLALASKLKIACNHVRLLRLQGRLLHGIDVHSADTPLAIEAASEISKAVDDMIMNDALRIGQHESHLISSIFSALFLLTYQRRAEVDSNKKHIMQKWAQSCLTGLRMINNMPGGRWEFNDEIMCFFDKYMGDDISAQAPKNLKLSARPEARDMFSSTGQCHEVVGPAAAVPMEPEPVSISGPFNMMFGPWGCCEGCLLSNN